MNPNTEKLRKKYMDNPPEGITSEDIRRMSEDDLLDMDYFLNEDDKIGLNSSHLPFRFSKKSNLERNRHSDPSDRYHYKTVLPDFVILHPPAC